jgi:hypothetical protein
MSDADKGVKPMRSDLPESPKKGDVVNTRDLKKPANPKGKGEKPEQFKPGPGPDDPSVPYDDGSDRDVDDGK